MGHVCTWERRNTNRVHLECILTILFQNCALQTSHQQLDLPIALISSPKTHSTTVAGVNNAIGTNANTLFPHPYPSFLYMLGPNSGNAKAARLFSSCDAAVAEPT